MKMIHAAAVLVMAMGPGVVARGQTGGGGAPVGTPASQAASLAKMEALAAANKAALVVVEYQLQYDKGDAPVGSGFAERCPFCGQYHSTGDLEDSIREERPLELPGVLVDGTHVVTNDLQLHPRFIKSLKVRTFGGDFRSGTRVDATISAYPKQQNALLLELAGPLAGTKAASFDAQRAGPYTVVHGAEAEGRWAIGLQAMPQDLVMLGGKSYYSSTRGLVVDKDGGAVGMTTGLEIPADGAWKGSPMQWPAYTSAAMKEVLGKVQGRVDKGVVPVTLNFRSPKSTGPRERFTSREDEATVQHVLGVFTDSKTVLVLANLKATTTARLERIRVMTDPPMDAKFAATLSDYGALVAKTETAASGMPGLSTADLAALRGAALPAADILLQGENRVTYVQERRIASIHVGFRGNLYPEIPARDEALFLFDGEGDLLALPLAQREKASTESRYGGGAPLLTSVVPVKNALADLGANSDKNNVPLSEDEEGRLAWLGFELQPLTQELARANGVADQTQDGRTGALVTFVYPNSPAAQAGVQMGWVLLRLDVEGQPKPIDVDMEGDIFSDEPFPWDRLDSAPETVFDRIPTPWPSAENSLLRSLTDIGFGKKFVAEFAHDKKLDKKDFAIVQGPPTFQSAPKYKSAGLGITVRDLTYEVRRYMQKQDDDPGVIIGKIEMGSKASVAGLKPYEVITHVNDQPVRNVKDFENASKDQTELRLSIKRMAAGRIVKITLPKADSAATQPGK
jgi:serine protease Do